MNAMIAKNILRPASYGGLPRIRSSGTWDLHGMYFPSDAAARRTGVDHIGGSERRRLRSTVNRSRSVHWMNVAVSSCELHWTKDDAVGALLYSPADMNRRREHDEEEADYIVQRAKHWRKKMKYLPNHLRLRLELEPNEFVYWKYCAEFLDLADLTHFELECQAHLPPKARQREAREHRRRAKELQACLSNLEDDVQSDSPVESDFACTTNPRRKEDFLKSDLGKYWELPEQTTRRVRKRVVRFSPC